MSQPTSIDTRRLFARSMLVVVAGLSSALCGSALAQNSDSVVPTTDIETSPYTFAGEVNSDTAVVRSGPSENDYPTLRLAKGDKLVVVGYRFDWLKVEPPAGSFCLVSQAFVDKRGDGTIGRIANQRATVRVGSSLTLSKHKVPMQLEPGTDVQILGEVDEFYKIAPPKGVFMYVDKRFVNPVRKLDDNQLATANNGNPAGNPTVPQTGNTTSTDAPSGSTPQTETTTQDGRFVVSSGGGTTTEPNVSTTGGTTAGTTPGTTGGTTGGTTPPSADAPTPVATDTIQKLQDKLANLEDAYTAAAQKDITEQPIDDLLKGYNALLAEEALPPNARKVAEYRANALKLRAETLEQFLATKKMQAEIAQKQQDLKAEQDELQQRVAEVAVKRYAAVGRLVQSSLQVGQQTLYRLVDPATRRTIIYVRTGDKPLGANLDQFVGIEGTIINDEAARLTYVQPKDVVVVDPSQVNIKVFGDYSPPSLATQTVAGTSESSAPPAP